MSNYVTKEELEEAVGVQAKIVGSYTFDSKETKTVAQCDYAELISLVKAEDTECVALTDIKTIVFKGGTAYVFEHSSRSSATGSTATLNSYGTSLSVDFDSAGSSIFVTAVCYKYV